MRLITVPERENPLEPKVKVEPTRNPSFAMNFAPRLKSRSLKALLLILLAFCLTGLSGYFVLTNTIAGDEGVYVRHDGRFEANGLLYAYLHSAFVTGYHHVKTEYLHWNPRPDPIECRGLAFGFGLLMLLAAFLLGKEIADKYLGTLYLFCLGVNSLQLASMSCERFYTISGMFSLLATLMLLRACRLGRWYRWLGYIICVLGLLFSMLLGTTVLIIHLAIVIRCGYFKRARLPLALTAIIALGCLIPLYKFDATAMERFDHGTFRSDSWAVLGASLLANGFAEDSIDCAAWRNEHIYEDVRQARHQTLAGLSIISLMIMIAAGIPAAPQKRLGRTATRAYSHLGQGLGVGLILAALIFVAISIYVKNIVVARSLVCLMPYAMLLLALGLRAHRALTWMWMLTLIFAAPLLMVATSMYQNLDKRAMLWVLDQYRRGDVLISDNSMQGMNVPEPLQSICPPACSADRFEEMSGVFDHEPNAAAILDALIRGPYHYHYKRIFVMSRHINNIDEYLGRFPKGYIGDYKLMLCNRGTEYRACLLVVPPKSIIPWVVKKTPLSIATQGDTVTH